MTFSPFPTVFSNLSKTEIIIVRLQNECFRGYTGISPSVRPCVCLYKILVSVKALVGVLTLYHTVVTFKDPEERAC